MTCISSISRLGGTQWNPTSFKDESWVPPTASTPVTCARVPSRSAGSPTYKY
ncbi:MAG: hypothetical protein ACHBN1_03770 [Heteroscytonema crispum UTEX LB 1556]